MGLEATIHLLPEGFETALGEGIADDLPASIAQQVNIVRALTSNPGILILDEANTVLDRAAEGALRRALDNFHGHLTVIVVSHRPSLLARCDGLLIVENGQVARQMIVRDLALENCAVKSQHFRFQGDASDRQSVLGAPENQVHASLTRLADEFGPAPSASPSLINASLSTVIDDIVEPGPCRGVPRTNVGFARLGRRGTSDSRSTAAF